MSPYTYTIDRLLELVAADATSLVCKWGHDHSRESVKAFNRPKSSPGNSPGSRFHCAKHDVVKREDDWTDYASARAAAESGHVLPCGTCFPNFSKASNEWARRHGIR